MKKIKCKFLIFILFLSPFVQAVDAVGKYSMDPSVIEAPSCHETKQSVHESKQSLPEKNKMDCECQDCLCGSVCNNLTVINTNKPDLFLSSNTLVEVFNTVIPYKESHPPFRPPII